MSDDQSIDTPAPDAFEAQLAANATEVATETVVEEIAVEESSAVATDDLALASDEDGDIESEENDPNAEFRRTLRTALGDWYVVHSYAGY
ncbi:MAG: transcription termination/antitermination factor NusG, partial [Actinobacteria bacterium]|nr:transcription termination/antitermination factor NusG [Actinomycetota bacterium]